MNLFVLVALLCTDSGSCDHYALDNSLSSYECDYYNDKALFYRDGSVEVVSYKGEGEHFFDTVEDYKEWVNSPKWRFGMYDEDDYYGDED